MSTATPAQAAQFKAGTAAPGADPTKKSSQPVVQNAPFQIKSFQKKENYLNMLVYSQHGGGKTTLFATAVDCEPMRDVLMIDAESGDLAIQDNPRIKRADLISHIRVTSFKQVAWVHDFLQAHCRYRDANDIPKLKELESRVTGIPANEIQTPKLYRTVIIDSLTEVDQYSLYKLQGMDQMNLTEDPESLDVARFEEFRKNNEMVKMLVRAFRDLPMHVLFSCSAQYTQNELKKFHYAPAMTGKLASQVQGMMDIVGFMVVASGENDRGERDRRLFIQPGEVGTARYDAKNRRAIYKEAYFENPDMTTIMHKTGMLNRG